MQTSRPATDLLLERLAETVKQVQEHDHPDRAADIYCLNLVAWMGEHMGSVLARLEAEQVEVRNLRDRLSALADEFTEHLKVQQ